MDSDIKTLKNAPTRLRRPRKKESAENSQASEIVPVTENTPDPGVQKGKSLTETTQTPVVIDLYCSLT